MPRNTIPAQAGEPPAKPRRRPRPSLASRPPSAVPLVDAELLEAGETLEEAESEIGINAWLDNETGEPAEGQSPPRPGLD